MSELTVAEIELAFDENASAPYGPARSARAERLVEAAAQTGDRPLLVRGLVDLIDAYEYDGECEHILVPFARLLKMWDDRPGDFDAAARHSLHWYFKWVTSGMITQPTVPLDTMRRWLGEMETRYRQAGYTSHAVCSCQYDVAAHIGDRGEAQRAFDAWQAAQRDQMSDCHACDRHNTGDWYVEVGRDDEALRAWHPVLSGRLSCAEEPHRVLATSLLPLVRLGRLAEARANHLRGYRMVRGNANLRKSVGRHLEFAALTGNEARGLEILAEHATWLQRGGENVFQRMQFLCGVGVLLGRLHQLGHDDLAIATPDRGAPDGAGRTTPAGELLVAVRQELTEISRRFDERNGTTAVSDEVAARLGREPLVASLPLGSLAGVLRAAPQSASDPAPQAASDAAAAAAESTSDAAASEPASDTGGEGAPLLTEVPDGATQLRLAEEHWQRGGSDAEVVDRALMAALLLSDTDPAAAAQARLLAAFAFRRADRMAEAVGILELALPGIRECGDELDQVKAQRLYGLCLGELGEHRESAEALLGAAAIARTWPDQTAHAFLAHDAGFALEQAGLIEEADRSLARAADLWQSLDCHGEQIRAIRARACLVFRRTERDWPGALALMDAAKAVGQRPDLDSPKLRFEHWSTLRQIAGLILNWCDETEPATDILERGLAEAEAAAKGFDDLDCFSDAGSAYLIAAEFESQHLGRRDDGLARLKILRQAAVERGDKQLVASCDRHLKRF